MTNAEWRNRIPDRGSRDWGFMSAFGIRPSSLTECRSQQRRSLLPDRSWLGTGDEGFVDGAGHALGRRAGRLVDRDEHDVARRLELRRIRAIADPRLEDFHPDRQRRLGA